MNKTNKQRKKHKNIRNTIKKGGVIGHVRRLFRTQPPRFSPRTKDELKQAVDFYCEHNTTWDDTGIDRYGHISTWDVSGITDMSRLFEGKSQFNENISDWDVSNVTNMSQMFKGCHNFNQPLNWNVSRVTNMSQMFYHAINFNQRLTTNGLSWNVRNVRNMSYMFWHATNFNQPLNWNVNSLADTTGMFDGANSYNYPRIRQVNRVEEILQETERNRIRIEQERDPEPQQPRQFRGVANEVHNAFYSIDMNALFDTIKPKDIDTLPGTITPNEFYIWIESKIDDNFDIEDNETRQIRNNLKASKHKLIRMNFDIYKDVYDKLGSILIKKFIEAIMAFVDSQPKQFIINYIRSYIKEIIGAYSDDYDNESSEPNSTTTSCVDGMFERIFLCLRLGGLEMEGTKNEKIYIKIAKIIGKETVVDDTCETQTQTNISDELIMEFVSNCVQKYVYTSEPEIKKELLKHNMNERRDILAKCILKKLVEKGDIPQPTPDNLENYDQTLVGRIREHLDQPDVKELYTDDFLLEGGKGKRKTRKNKKNRLG